MAGKKKVAPKAEPAARSTRASKRKATDVADEAPAAEEAASPQEPPSKRTSKRKPAADAQAADDAPAETPAAAKPTRGGKRKPAADAPVEDEAAKEEKHVDLVDEPAETPATKPTRASRRKSAAEAPAEEAPAPQEDHPSDSEDTPAAGTSAGKRSSKRTGAVSAKGAAGKRAPSRKAADAAEAEVKDEDNKKSAAKADDQAADDSAQPAAEQPAGPQADAVAAAAGATEKGTAAPVDVEPAAAADEPGTSAAAQSQEAGAAQPSGADEPAAQPSPGKKGSHPGRGRSSGRGRQGRGEGGRASPGRGRQGRGEPGRGSPGRDGAGRGGGRGSTGRGGRGRGAAGRGEEGRGRSGRGGPGRGGRGRGAAQEGRGASTSQGAGRNQRAHKVRANRILQRHASAVAAGQMHLVPMQMLQPMPFPGQMVIRPHGAAHPQPHPPSHPPPGAANSGAPARAPPVSSDPLLRSKQTQMVLSQPTGAAISFSELKSDVVIALAEKTWGLSAPADAEFDPRIVTRLYRSELAMPRRSSAALRRIQILEVSQYLERYLWPHFDPETASPEHVMSIVIMVNEKIREGVPAWEVFLQPRDKAEGEEDATEAPEEPNTDAWHAFVKCAVEIGVRSLHLGSRAMGPQEVEQYLRFVIHLFQSLESEHVRGAVMRLASLPIWAALSDSRLELELRRNPDAAKKWKSLAKKDKKAATKAAAEGKEHVPLQQRPEATFLPALLDHFLELIPTVIRPEPVKSEAPATNGTVTATTTGADGDEDAMQVDHEASVATGAADVNAGDEEGAPVRFFEDPNEPLRLEDLPAEPEEAQLLDMGDEDAAPGTAMTDAPELDEDVHIDLDAILPHSDAPLTTPAKAGVDRGALRACERFLELLVDLLSQLPTRRFLVSVVAERGIVVRARMSTVASHPAGTLFCQLLDQLTFYTTFPIDDHTGDALTDIELGRRADNTALQLQRLLFTRWPTLRTLALTNCASLRDRTKLSAALAPLSLEELKQLACTQLRLVRAEDCDLHGVDFVREVLVSHFAMRTTPRAAIAAMPLYPTETLLWDDKQIPSTHYAGDAPLALPKLNLQFLTFWDYLLRNFNLFRLEATYEIREDVTDTLRRLQPRRNESTGAPEFMGWSRMAIKIESFVVVEVARPRVGEVKPAAVTAELVIDLAQFKRHDVKDEWDELKEHDVLFLLNVQPPSAKEAAAAMASGGEDAISRAAGLQCLRGAEVIEIRDSQGALFNDFRGRVRPEDAAKGRSGSRRTLLLALDAAQYQIDVDTLEPEGGTGKAGGAAELYASFNVVQRRKAKENNFKAVLESIRDLMTESTTIPAWMHDLFLGYGAPEDTQFAALENTVRHIDFRDTFLDASHVPAAFPDHAVQFVDDTGAELPIDQLPAPPYTVTFPPFSSTTKQSELPEGIPEPPENTLVVRSYKTIKSTPFPEQQPGQNNIRFNTEQLRVVLSGMQPGLTMCVGPPGTGKTDTAVQVLTMLYHNYPQQRTLVVAHSNQALNDVFSKTIQRDVPARYLLRLGMGQEDLDTDVDFSRTGRVNAMLQRRLDLLEQVATLAQQLGESEDAGYTCETAGYFFLLHVLGRWERFNAAVAKAAPDDMQAVSRLFPFIDFFVTVPPPLFAGVSREGDMEAARVCWRHLRTMFTELQECRAFELLRGQADRVNYLVSKHAKVVAMTCTHAALKRREFLNLGFRYDTLVMEESAQILEIETLLPMLLQSHQDGHNRLKRIVLIGDHHQLPPVVKNQAFQRYSKMDQPLFTRFIRLGVPHTELSAQGRARPLIADLYNWRYRALGNLPHVVNEERFCKPNAGFVYNFQFIDVPPMMGPGESCPTPYFYQNIDEAEYAVRMFMYMRLIGYPASKITILTSYNGQKALLEDVVQKHCARYPAFGVPAKIATVDKYQGQQNDYVLLSLVRTRRVGHLRDVRRLVVAMSRARLGLYVLGCRSLFEQCLELAPTFRKLLQRPSVLALMVRERWGVPGGVLRESEGGGVEAGEGGVVVHTLQQMEGVVQGIADRYQAERSMMVAQAAQAQMAQQAHLMQQTQLGVVMQPVLQAANGAIVDVSGAAPPQETAAEQATENAVGLPPVGLPPVGLPPVGLPPVGSEGAARASAPEAAGEAAAGTATAGQEGQEGAAPMDTTDT